MQRRMAVIASAVCGAVLLLSGAADPQQPPRPPQPPYGECVIGSVEERLDCLGRELARQRLEMRALKWELENMMIPRVVPLFDHGGTL